MTHELLGQQCWLYITAASIRGWGLWVGNFLAASLGQQPPAVFSLQLPAPQQGLGFLQILRQRS